MNCYLYGHDGKWLMVDLGITFAAEGTPGIKILMPNLDFIEQRREDLVGLVLTHGHEDHLGAVAYLWPKLNCPIYATPFTAALLRRKLAETGLEGKVPLHEIALGGDIHLPPFEVGFVTLTHSIPEPNALAIRTPLGTVLHSGDWKLDPDPLIGAPPDEAALRSLGEEGVLAMTNDSTNVMVEGTSGSEADLRNRLTELIGRFSNRVVVACFATNVARLFSIAAAAKANGRAVALAGRSLWRIDDVARETGVLKGLPPFLDDEAAVHLPRDEIVLVCTGSQGEPRAALSQIVKGGHRNIRLEEGDVVIFSSRVIPGNEKAIANLQDELVRNGIEVITAADHDVHVSGHPARVELRRMYEWVRPRFAIPMHGEPRHLRAHVELAKACQVPAAIQVENGELLRITQDTADIVDEVPTGRLALDGKRLVPLDDATMKFRRSMHNEGLVVATVVMNGGGTLASLPMVTAPGLLDPETDAAVLEEAAIRVAEAVEDLSSEGRGDAETLTRTIRLAARRYLRDVSGKKPQVEVHLVRLSGSG
ncbi:MAG: ribonuclease J [Alphaproteobacteria bacterium]|nr:ribonuclease J [Alphaproteobacteria bacterium]